MLARDFMASFDEFRDSLDRGSRKANLLAWALFAATVVQAAAAICALILK
jgi:hypothetical protein